MYNTEKACRPSVFFRLRVLFIHVISGLSLQPHVLTRVTRFHIQKSGFWQVITYEDDFMKFEIHITLVAEMYIKAQFILFLTTYTYSDILTKILVFLPVNREKNCLLSTKLFHMIIKFIGFSSAIQMTSAIISYPTTTFTPSMHFIRCLPMTLVSSIISEGSL